MEPNSDHAPAGLGAIFGVGEKFTVGFRGPLALRRAETCMAATSVLAERVWEFRFFSWVFVNVVLPAYS